MPKLLSASVTYPEILSYSCKFGPWIMHQPGWDRYVLFFTQNCVVKNGKPVDVGLVPGPYDQNTWNTVAPGYFGDKIWMTWHFGDGMDPKGWDCIEVK